MLDSLDPNTLRLGFFAGIFAIMALIEVLLPKRDLSVARASRWPTNWGIVILDAALVRLLFPIGGIGLAALAVERGWGLLPMLGWQGGLLAGVFAFLVLDFAVWFQHWAAHKIPVLWRIHRVHHADGDVDVTTALRFHPIEILLSFLWKAAFILALGGPVWAVIAFEIVLNGAAMFNHANVALPKWLDRGLRWLIVTPDMHRVHHSARVSETDSNYGFNLSIWDRMFRTYTDQPLGGHRGMTIGLDAESADGARKFGWSLAYPFHPLKPKNLDQ
ncbi:fatty acid hydroxylase [Roseibium aquae]|uniref:Fatty acid hydroxylase n=1 Tax=Roseibium aquae TaxID=1323746 RepID=A0A916TN14_9HYPH|nr:sterol desaturase family protein [Roseibium aquae]GGB51261.1 fatty acid hydroxylase [Roseibium aquae]